MPELNPQQFDYRGSHRPPDPGDDVGAPLHDVEQVMPGFHERPKLYDFHERGVSDESIRSIRAARGNPDHEVPIYRAVPKAEYGIRPGDWVSTSRRYAELHAAQPYDHEWEEPKPDWPVVEGRAKARELLTHGDDPNEWGYHPDRDR
jgi:hypothetical protein